MDFHYKVMIIEKDSEHINLLKHYFGKLKLDLNLVFIAKDLFQAQIGFKKHQPDILITAIQLDDQNIFDILDSLVLSNTELIFSSSFSSYGIKAIDYRPIGFLLKPYNFQSFSNTIKKAISRIQSKENSITEIETLITNSQIAISSLDKIDVIHFDDILFIEADGRYSHFHLKTGKITASKNLGSYEKQLQESRFHRIHSKYIVNISAIKSIHRDSGVYCVLENQKDLPISRRRFDSLMNLFIK